MCFWLVECMRQRVALSGQGTIGSLRRFFGDFLSLVKESHPSETGQTAGIAAGA